MKTLFKLLFGNKIGENATLSGFFKGAPTKEKKQIIEEVIEKSNKDQRELAEKYKQKFSVGTRIGPGLM